MDNQDKCTICLQDFTEMYSLESCNHSFCKECISKYVSFNLRNLKCPLCRSNINLIDLNEIYPEFYEQEQEEELNYTDRLLINLGMESDLDLMAELEQEHQIEEYLEQERQYELYQEHLIEEYLEQERIYLQQENVN
jgi:hypothetical protein